MKPFHKHVKDSAGLARLRRPLMTRAHLSQGHSFDTRMTPASVAGAELKHACGCDLPAREAVKRTVARSHLDNLHGSDAVRVLSRVTG